MNFLRRLLQRDPLESIEVQPEEKRVEAMERDLDVLEKQLEVFKYERGEYERASGQ